MILLKRSSSLLMVALLLGALGCAPTSARESTVGQVDDTVITTRVKTAIFNDPSLKTLQINVETYRNVVQLSGFVSSSIDMDKAIRHARTVNGVNSVRNDMRLK